MSIKAYLPAVAAVIALSIAAGAAPAAETRLQPSDAAAPVPPLQYQSVFSSYRQPQAERKLDWKQANDTVRDVGGHAGAMQEEAAPSSYMDSSHRHGGQMGGMPMHQPGQGMKMPEGKMPDMKAMPDVKMPGMQMPMQHNHGQMEKAQ